MDEFTLHKHNPAEESINFGYQNVGSGLNESVTLLSLVNNKLGEKLVITSVADQNVLYLAIDSQIWIVSDILAGTVGFTHTFSSNINTFAIIGDLVLLGLTNGEVHLISLNLKQIIGFCSITTNVWTDIVCFVGIYAETVGNKTFLVLTHKGQLYRVSFDDNDQSLKSELVVDLLNTITTASYIKNQLLAIGKKMILYDIKLNIIDEETLPEGIEIQKIWPSDEATFLCLKTDGLFCTIDTDLFVFDLIEYNDRICDFVWFTNPNKSVMYYVTSENHIKMNEYDTEKTEVFDLKVDNFLLLVNTKWDYEHQRYLTRQGNTIRMHEIQKSEPEKRLERLICLMKYNEAYEFAKQYGLSSLEVDKAKITNFQEIMTCTDDDVDELLRLLETYPDVSFQAKSCNGVLPICESIAGVKKILNYMAALDFTDVNDRSLELIVNTLMSRFDLYCTLSIAENTEISVAEFQSFMQEDLFQTLLTALSDNSNERALILISRLNHPTYTLQNVAVILEYLHKYKNIPDYIALLSAMLPTTLLHLPESMCVFVHAIIDKVHHIERASPGEFPEAAIGLVDKMLKILNADIAMGVRTSFKEQSSNSPELPENLFTISKYLTTILELKNNYNISMSLHDCLAGPSAMLSSFINLNIASVEKFVKNFLIDFMIRNEFDPDLILSDLIQRNLCDSDVPALWKYINSNEKKLELLLDILRAVPKPWNAEVKQMMSAALEWNHPLVQNVRQEAYNEEKYIVLCRPEYKLFNESLESMERDLFAIPRIITCNLPTLVDDVYTLCTTEMRRRDCAFLLIIHFIKTNNLQNLITTLKRHTVKEAEILLGQLCMFYRDEVIDMNVESRTRLISAFEIIAQRANCSNVRKALFDYYKMIEVLPSEMISRDLCGKVRSIHDREEILIAVLRDLEINYDYQSANFTNLLHKTKKISRAFNISHCSLVFRLSQLTKDLNLVYDCAQEINQFSDDVETLSLMSVYILKNIGIDRDLHATFNDTIQDDSGKAVDEKFLGSCMVLAKQMVTKALILSDGDLKVAKVFAWILNTTYLNGERIENKPDNGCLSIFGGTPTNMFTLNLVYTGFCMISSFIRESYNAYGFDYLTHMFSSEMNLTDSENEDCTRESIIKMFMARLTTCAPTIIRENHYWTLLRILATIQSQLLLFEEPAANEIIETALHKFRKEMLVKIFSARNIDENMAFTVLLCYNKSRAIGVVNDAMRLYKLNFTKFETIVKIGKRITTFYNSSDQYGSTLLGIKWRKELTTCSLSLKEFFLALSKNELLEPLITNKEISLEQITEFCADYNLNVEEYYLKYLNVLFASWKPTYNIEADSCGGRTINVQCNEDDLTGKALNVVNLLTNRDAILKCVDSMWSTTNFYYYEVFMAMLSVAVLLEDHKHVHFRMVLRFLKDYQRKSKPNAVETDEWSSRFVCESIDPISEWRLPFTPTLFTANLWKILRGEVVLANYEKWFGLVGLPLLQVDEICSMVVKDVVFTGGNSGDARYVLKPEFKHVFDDIDNCLAHITDPILAASVAFSVIHKLREGADRVLAWQLAYKYATRSKESGTGCANYTQIETGFFTYSTQHILHLYNLTDPKYLSLLDSPDLLIRALFGDDRIVKPSRSCLSQCPNINKAVDEIVNLYKMDNVATRIKLIQEWLSDAPSGALSDDFSICLLPDANEISLDTNHECVLRAAYLCSGDDVAFWREHLFDMFENTEKYLVQGRILKIIHIISPPDEIKEKYECSNDAFLDTIRNFFLLHDLQSLGMKIELEHFVAMDKKRLIQKLCKKLSDPISIKVITSLSFKYQIFDFNIWEKVIDVMIKLNMINDIKECITMFTNQETMTFCKFYLKAWQFVVDASFDKMETCDDIDGVFIDLMHFVQASPVLRKLKFNKGLTACLLRKRLDYYCYLLQFFAPPQQKEKLIALSVTNKKELLAQVEKLRDKGLISLHIVSDLIRTIINA